MNQLFVAFKIVAALFVLVLTTQSLSAQEVVVEGGTPELTFAIEDEVFLIDSSTESDVTVSGPKGDYTVRVTGGGTNEDVDLSTSETGGSDSANITLDIPSTPGEVTYTAKIVDEEVEAEKKVTAVKVTIDNPTGNPFQKTTAKEGINEFTYTGATVGVCRIPCRAKLEPDTEKTTKWAETNISWTSSATGGGNTTWEGGSNSGKSATLQLTGLPSDNSGFGSETVTMSGGQEEETTNIQVFFDRDATNHPGDDQTPAGSGSTRSPNWFYYWGKSIGFGGSAYFNSNAPAGAGAGAAPAMLLWANPLTYSKSEIWLTQAAVGSYTRRDGSGRIASGIDMVANVFAHEREHTNQITRADALLARGDGIWASGWSWGQIPNNHYNPGPPITRLSPNNRDWPYAWPVPANPSGATLEVEAEARLQETIADGDYKDADYADDGKQHLTEEWND